MFELRRNGWDKIGAAVTKAAEEFRCSETKVWGCLKELREILREQERIAELNAWFNWYDKRREEKREEERREEERAEEERREEEYREQWMAAEAHLIETNGQGNYTDKEIEDAIALLEQGRLFK